MYTTFSEGHLIVTELKIIFQQQYHWNVGGGASSQDASFKEKNDLIVSNLELKETLIT